MISKRVDGRKNGNSNFQLNVPEDLESASDIKSNVSSREPLSGIVKFVVLTEKSNEVI